MTKTNDAPPAASSRSPGPYSQDLEKSDPEATW